MSNFLEALLDSQGNWHYSLQASSHSISHVNNQYNYTEEIYRKFDEWRKCTGS